MYTPAGFDLTTHSSSFLSCRRIPLDHAARATTIMVFDLMAKGLYSSIFTILVFDFQVIWNALADSG
jgi:hypothetical protein